MSKNVVINGKTYEDVERILMLNDSGEIVFFYPDAPLPAAEGVSF